MKLPWRKDKPVQGDPDENLQQNLQSFLNTHGLSLEGRIYGDTCVLSVARAETKDAESDPFLTSTTGRGATPALARADLARRISGKIIVIESGSAQRRQIPIPDLAQHAKPAPLPA